MEFSPNGIDFLKKLEQFKMYPYRDSAGRWTIGYGTLIGQAPDGTFTIPKISEPDAAKLLLEHANYMVSFLTKLVAVPLTQDQFDALVVFVYNIGPTEFSHSTMLKLLNQKDYVGASKQFSRWIYSGGQIVDGLINRRKMEETLFNTK